MSGFCVFGLTKSLVKSLAKQAVDRQTPPNGGWQPEEYLKAIQEKEAAILQKNHPNQISPAYSSPFRCEEFIELARKSGELISAAVMYRGSVRESKTSGRPVMTWLKYSDSQDAMALF